MKIYVIYFHLQFLHAMPVMTQKTEPISQILFKIIQNTAECPCEPHFTQLLVLTFATEGVCLGFPNCAMTLK